MKTFLKVTLYLSGAVVVLLIAAGLWLARIDPNEHKDWIADKVQEETGRTLQLGGELSFSLYPWLGFEAQDLALGNAAGFGTEPFFQADYLAFRIKTLPLLQQKYEIDTARIHGAVLNLARDEAGRSNWQDLAGTKEKETGAFPLTAIIVGGIDVRDAALNWRDQGSDTHYVLRDLNFSTGELVYGAPMDIRLSLQMEANKPALTGALQLHNTITYEEQRYTIKPFEFSAQLAGANIPGQSTEISFSSLIEANSEEDTLSVSDISFTALGTQISGKLRMDKLQGGQPTIAAQLEAEGEDLARLFKIAEIEPLATKLAQLPQRGFSLNTRLEADAARGDVDVPVFSARLLGAKVEGSLKARNARSERGEYEGRIAAAGPDLPALLQLAGQFAGEDSALRHYAPGLSSLERKEFLLNADFVANLKNGDIAVPTLVVKALGIDIRGALAATAMQSAKGSVKGELALEAKRLSPLLQAIEQEQLAGLLDEIRLAAAISGGRADLQLAPLNFIAVLAGGQVANAPLTLNLQAADTRIDLEQGRVALDGLALKGAGLDVQGSLVADDLQRAPEFNGQLLVAPFDLRELIRRLGQDELHTAAEEALKKVALQGRFAASNDFLAIREFGLQLDGSTIGGSFSMQDFRSPAYRFELEVDRLNLDHYLPPTPSAADKSAQPLTPESTAAARLPLALLRSLDVEGKVAAAKLTAAGLKLEDVAVDLAAKAGEIKLEDMRAALYEGSYRGNVKLDAAAKLPRLTVNSALKGVQLEPLLRDAAGLTDLVGRGDASLAVVAVGTDTAAFKQTLNGLLELRMGEGILRGVDVRKVLQQVEVMIESKRLGKLDKSGVTHFDSLSATLPVSAGVITNEDLLLAAPGFQVTGKGVLARLADMTWEYDLDVAVTEERTVQGAETYNLGGYTIPIRCRGKIEGKNCTPDIGGLAGMAAKKIILDKIFKEPRKDKEPERESDPRKELLDKALRGIFN